MAGYDNIDSTTPAGTAAANTIDDQFRELKADILAGVQATQVAYVSAADNGQVTAAHQGMHMLERRVNTGEPTASARPVGYPYIRKAATSGVGSSTSRLRWNDSGTWTNIGIYLLEKIGLPVSTRTTYATAWDSDSVANGALTQKIISAFTAGSTTPQFFLIDATVDSSNAPQIIFGPPSNPNETTPVGTSTAGIYVWKSLSDTDGNIYLNIFNDSGNTETVYTSVAQVMFD